MYWSNCFIEAIKAKIKYGEEIKVIHLKAKENEVYCPHWVWHDLRDNNVYDFHAPAPYHEHWWNFLLFKGSIRIRPYSIWEKWLAKNSLTEILHTKGG